MLLQHDLVAVFWLMIYPITLGRGKRLFAEGTLSTAFKVTESQVNPQGVMVMNYERSSLLTSK
jgi:dihydrofolate reductase